MEQKDQIMKYLLVLLLNSMVYADVRTAEVKSNGLSFSTQPVDVTEPYKGNATTGIVYSMQFCADYCFEHNKSACVGIVKKARFVYEYICMPINDGRINLETGK